MLRVLRSGDEYHEVADDIQEVYKQLMETGPKWKARLWYFFRVVESIPSFVSDIIYWRILMLNNYPELFINVADTEIYVHYYHPITRFI